MSFNTKQEFSYLLPFDIQLGLHNLEFQKCLINRGPLWIDAIMLRFCMVFCESCWLISFRLRDLVILSVLHKNVVLCRIRKKLSYFGLYFLGVQIMKRKFKQWRSTIPTILTKWNSFSSQTTDHKKKKTTTYCIVNPCPGLRQA